MPEDRMTSEQTDNVEEEIASLRKALEEEKARAESYLANWQRAQADYINLKRRTEQEKAEATKFANSMLILNLLPVLDDFERAFNSLSARLAGLTWVDGIRLIYRKFQSVLEAHGLSEIEALGKPFDPYQHEAIMYQEGEEGVVLEVVQKGYRLHDRVIRPAMVIVGKAKEEAKAEPQSQGSESEKDQNSSSKEGENG